MSHDDDDDDDANLSFIFQSTDYIYTGNKHPMTLNIDIQP